MSNENMEWTTDINLDIKETEQMFGNLKYVFETIKGNLEERKEQLEKIRATKEK